MKFFFIREEVIAMLFCEPGVIDKEDTPIPKKAAWYDKLFATPNRAFGEQVLVLASMSDKWPERSREVPVLLLNGEGVLRDFGIDYEEKRPNKTAMKKKVTIAVGQRVRRLGPLTRRLMLLPKKVLSAFVRVTLKIFS
ncbi:hypothetical protein HanIR_Chr16g0807861 [Helianthus annuus]|nr:hypothetical protein HanIR_Chr16g0807861 [Helianthus annuus]KAJ0640539.1 hypothetical protein HanLR1_Chr16g0616651 [Helianthus annuus]